MFGYLCHSIKNNYDLINRIENTNLEPNHILTSFDIAYVFTNVPVNQIIEVLQSNLNEHSQLSTATVNEIAFLLFIILTKNYF